MDWAACLSSTHLAHLATHTSASTAAAQAVRARARISALGFEGAQPRTRVSLPCVRVAAVASARVHATALSSAAIDEPSGSAQIFGSWEEEGEDEDEGEEGEEGELLFDGEPADSGASVAEELTASLDEPLAGSFGEPLTAEQASEAGEAEGLVALDWRRLSRHVGAYASTPAVRDLLLRGPGLPLPTTRAGSELLHAQTEAVFALRARTGSWPSLSGVADCAPIALGAAKGAILEEPQLMALASTLEGARVLARTLRNAASETPLDEAAGEGGQEGGGGGSGGGWRRPPSGGGGEQTAAEAAAVAPLWALLRDRPLCEALRSLLRATLDDNGRVRDAASPALAAARAAAAAARASIRGILGAFANGARSDALAERAPVLRDGRYCLAVKASQRSRVRGAVLGESVTGGTVYIAPSEAADEADRLARALADERRALRAVLRSLSAAVGARASELTALAVALEAIDLAAARGRYGDATDAVTVTLEGAAEAPGLRLRQFRHPLLEFPSEGGPAAGVRAREQARAAEAEAQAEAAAAAAAAAAGGAQDPAAALAAASGAGAHARPAVTPVDFEVGPGLRCVVVTGPNTGGKTAGLKGLGLAALMARAGLRLPASASQGSGALAAVRLPWFRRVLADVGDGQSLQASLSTFSSHVRRSRLMCACADRDTLLLLDEVGMGTDPEEGAALAGATLCALADLAGLVLATSHHSALKALKYERSDFENAAVEFDEATLRPTYQWLWGVPGRSRALAIAKRLGVAESILQAAQARLRGEALSVEQVVAALTAERRRLADAADSAEDDADAARRARAEADRLLAAARAERARTEDSVRAQFELELQQARSEVGAAVARLQAEGSELNTLKSRSADAARTAALLSGLEAEAGRKGLSLSARAAAVSSGALSGEPVRSAESGDVLLHRELGEVHVLSPGKAGPTVTHGGLRVRVKWADCLELLRKRNAMAAGAAAVWTPSPGSVPAALAKRLAGSVGKKGPARTAGGSVSRPTAQVGANTVDVRGQFSEEAVASVEAALARANQYGALYVIHGLGTGRLREVVREEMGSHPFVLRVEDAPETQGGRGCTIVYLRD